ncbi:hypothetical protein [Methyloprofundus sp.]|uniref:hypothetical protein n=1 Tax=Methyloprofundus sp. TaxID=2020875 RepID=UPI003D0BD1D2
MQWQDVLADKSLQDLPYKIELNERGKIEMSPVSLIHSRLQGKLAKILGTELGGEIFTELAIETRLGVKVPDVAWGTEEYFQRIRLDCDREASHNLNRLLDKPGTIVGIHLMRSMKIAFC